jgi:hypothetical protein
MKRPLVHILTTTTLSLSGLMASDMLDLNNELQSASSKEVNITSPFINSWRSNQSGVILSNGDEPGLGFTNSPKSSSTSNNLDLGNLNLDDSTQKKSNNDLDLSLLLDSSPQKPTSSTIDLGDLLGSVEPETKNITTELGDLLKNKEPDSALLAEPAMAESSNNASTTSSPEQKTSEETPAELTDPQTSDTEIDSVAPIVDTPSVTLNFQDDAVLVEWPADLNPQNILITTQGPFKLEQLINLLKDSERLVITTSQSMEIHLKDLYKINLVKSPLPQVLKWISEIYGAPVNLNDQRLVL